MSNHFHMILRSPSLHLSLFMRDLQSLIARRVNTHIGRHGVFFPKRFDHAVIGDKGSLLTSMRYLLVNPVKAGLVSHPSEWPGLISHQNSPSHIPHHLTLLPQHSSWTQQFNTLSPIIDNKCAEYHKTISSFLGADTVCSTPWTQQPNNTTPKKKRRTLDDRVHCKGPARIAGRMRIL